MSDPLEPTPEPAASLLQPTSLPNPQPRSDQSTAGHATQRRRWPWVVGGLGCLTLVLLAIVLCVVVVKVYRNVAGEATERVKHLQTTGADKFIGNWKRDDDPTIQTFKTDGTFAATIFGKAPDGKPLTFSYEGIYRVDAATLGMTFNNVRLISQHPDSALIEKMAKEQAPTQMNFGTEQKGKITWIDRNTFSITESDETNVWKRQ